MAQILLNDRNRVGATLTLSYTPPVLNAFIASLPCGPAQDANGNQLAAFTTAAVTVTW